MAVTVTVAVNQPAAAGTVLEVVVAVTAKAVAVSEMVAVAVQSVAVSVMEVVGVLLAPTSSPHRHSHNSCPRGSLHWIHRRQD